MSRIVGAALIGALMAGSAAASDRVAYRAIAAGDFTTAVERLEAERRIHPQRPELMLNLAAAYGRTSREADARTLYAEVLRRPAVNMDLPNGSVASSHDVATRGLARIAPALASR
jgi:hypothetical protein